MRIAHLALAGTAAFAIGTAALAEGDKQSQRSDQPQASAGSSGMQQSRGSQDMSSDQVKQAQQALRQKGHDVGAADGILGPKTREGLKAFQQAEGIDASGQLDQRTLSALGIEGSATGADSASSGSSSPSQSRPDASSGASSPDRGGEQQRDSSPSQDKSKSY